VDTPTPTRTRAHTHTRTHARAHTLIADKSNFKKPVTILYDDGFCNRTLRTSDLQDVGQNYMNEQKFSWYTVINSGYSLVSWTRPFSLGWRLSIGDYKRPFEKGMVNCLYFFCSKSIKFFVDVERLHKITRKLYKRVQNDASRYAIFTSSSLAKNWVLKVHQILSEGALIISDQ